MVRENCTRKPFEFVTLSPKLAVILAWPKEPCVVPNLVCVTDIWCFSSSFPARETSCCVFLLGYCAMEHFSLECRDIYFTIGLKTRVFFTQWEGKSKRIMIGNHNSLAYVFPRFTSDWIVCVFLWLVRVTTLVFVLRHSVENRSSSRNCATSSPGPSPRRFSKWRIVVTIAASIQTTHHIRHSPYTRRRTCFGMSKTGNPTFLKHSVYLYNSLRKKFKTKQVTTKHWNKRYLDMVGTIWKVLMQLQILINLTCTIWNTVKLAKHSVSICMQRFLDVSRALSRLKISVRHK